MKKRIIASMIAVISVLSLSGCVLNTPVGRFTMEYDSAVKSENVEYTDETGKTQEINTGDLNEQIDNMLNDVDLPQGATTDDLKDFVHGTSEAIGVDKAIDEVQDSLDKAINDANTENGTVSEDNQSEEQTEQTEQTEENLDSTDNGTGFEINTKVN